MRSSAVSTPRDPFTGKHPIGLAESWTVEDPNTWIFHLRRNARWHDGSPFTAADIVHSIWRINNDKESKQKVQVSRVAEAEALDDYTVKLTTKGPTCGLTTSST